LATSNYFYLPLIAMEIISQQSYFQYFHNRTHLGTLTLYCFTEGTY